MIMTSKEALKHFMVAGLSLVLVAAAWADGKAEFASNEGRPNLSASDAASLANTRTYTVYVRFRSKPGAKWGSWNPLQNGSGLTYEQANRLSRETMDKNRNAQCKTEPD
jgi:hypothetical protein